MKRSIILVICLLVVLSVPSLALYPNSGPLSEGQILSDTLKQGKMSIGANIEYFSAADTISWASGDPEWKPINDDEFSPLVSFTCMVVPLRFAYGLSDNVSARITVPYVSTNITFVDGFLPDGENVAGSGIGDTRIEVLWQALNESSGGFDLGLNLGAKLATASTIPVTFDDGTGQADYLVVGTGANDVTLSAILKKTLGAMVGKASLTFVKAGTQNVQIEASGAFLPLYPGDHMLYSVAGEYQLQMFTVGAELWGMSLGKTSIPVSTGATMDNSEVSALYIAPYASFNVTKDLSIKGVVEVPLSQQATYNYCDMGGWGFKGMNLMVGATLNI
jgi:hypothetical protein